MNVAEVFPETTFTEAGTIADFELLVNLTVVPTNGAGPFNVTVPIADCPPGIAVGVTDIDANVGSTTDKAADLVIEPLVAEIVTDFCAATTFVATWNDASDFPAAIVIDVGTTTVLSLLDSETVSPPVNALPLNVTVPIEGLPPATEDGVNESWARVAGAIVSVVVCEDPLTLAVITAPVDVPTAEVVIVKVPEF